MTLLFYLYFILMSLFFNLFSFLLARAKPVAYSPQRFGGDEFEQIIPLYFLEEKNLLNKSQSLRLYGCPHCGYHLR